MNRNYIRVDTLSFSSIEIYMLFFLLISFGYILFRFKGSLSIKLICMYLLALPYTDMVYRFMGIQIYFFYQIWIVSAILNKSKIKDIEIKKFAQKGIIDLAVCIGEY